ncbi:hypothetical protein GCM10010307_54450 [Streptomyces vastus]|uniref:Uncharacterized protein n=1 Tax=Streptomyces vastus TaxID=285451 RepID=A0ABP6DMK4_9ACTN
MPGGTNGQSTKPLTGIVAVGRSPWQGDPPWPAVDCATLRALRFAVPHAPQIGPVFRTLTDEISDKPTQYNGRPAYRERYDNRITGRDRQARR